MRSNTERCTCGVTWHRAHKRLDVARRPAVEDAEPGARVVPFVVRVGRRAVRFPYVGVKAEPLGFRPVHHPVERGERHALPRVAAADVRMRARKPDLLDAPGLCRILELFVPQQRREAASRLVDGHGVAREPDLRAQLRVGELELPEERVDEIRQVQRQADGVHRVPDADEMDDGRRTAVEARDVARSDASGAPTDPASCRARRTACATATSDTCGGTACRCPRCPS